MGQQLNEYVLVVDDSESILIAFESALKEHGRYKYLLASDVDQALKRMKSNKVFLIISDFKMPGMSGIEFCEHLRKQQDNTPFVIITGYADKSVAIQSVNSGVSEFIEKPLNYDQIVGIVEKYGQQRKSELALERKEFETLCRSFADEAENILMGLDNLVLKMEESPDDIGLIDRIFRSLHTLKGASSIVNGSKPYFNLCHIFESTLSEIKHQRLGVSHEVINCMLDSIDYLKSQAEKIREVDFILENSEMLVQSFESVLEQAGLKEVTAKTAIPKDQPANEKKEDDEEDKGVLVSNKKLDQFMEFAGNLVTMKNIFEGYITSQKSRLGSGDGKLLELSKTLSKISDGIQMQIMEIRKVSLKSTFTKFRRLVRSTAASLKKQIHFEIEGESLEVDKNIAKALAAALVHAIRNSCDHGIEPQDERLKCGKPVIGKIVLSAKQVAEAIVVTVKDDGRGLNRDKVLKKAIDTKLISPTLAAAMSDSEINNLVFLPGFTTSAKVTEVSGRGVGMDVVKGEIERVGGTVNLFSDPGRSTTLEIKIPILKTVVVEHSLLVETKDRLLAIPLVAIVDIKPLKKSDLTFVKHSWTLQHQGHTIPVATYEQFLSHGFDSDHNLKTHESEMVIVLIYKNQHIALRVDRVVDQLEAVIRPFCQIIGKIKGFAGISILSDAQLAYVVSAEEMVGSFTSASNACLKQVI
jgi:two-component system chemotaxis sensor kinase CheA